MTGVALLQFTLQGYAQAPAPLPANAQANANTVLLPDRGNVTVLKLDDQLRTGIPIDDSKALLSSIGIPVRS